ncbi:hypothetical protein GUC36_06430 [Escherichia coli]|nr:hypothetical protein [Escherichia coli]
MPDATLDASYQTYKSVPNHRPYPACHKYSAGNINRLTPRTFNASANGSTSSGVALGQLCASPYTPWA